MERHPMRKVREILRLRFERGLSQRQISASTGVSKGALGDYLRRAARAGLTWEVARELDDGEIEARLFRYPGRNEPPRRVAIDLPWVHRELRRMGVTLQQLWLEYRDAAAQSLPSGGTPYGYSQFCDLYAAFRDRVDLSMRQVHRAGEKVFIDYSGKKPVIWSSETGEAIEVELYVAVLGASNYTYAEATRTQRLEDFCASTVRAFEFFGGVPQIAVPDQLRSAVSGPDRYDPDINPTYAELAQHYDVAIVPARPAKPRDKAKVEAAVLLAQRWILACLRNRTFFSLDELNAAIAELLENLNTRPFKKLDGCRRSAFEALDRPALRPLPQTRWELARWKKSKVNIDYHVEHDGRLYSVPHALVGERVELRVTSTVVEVFHRSRRVASHARLWAPKGAASTVPEHRPRSHREYGAWPPSRIVGWASSIGPSAATLVEQILLGRREPESAYRSCMALIRSAKRYDRSRFDAACRRAIAIGAPTRKSVLAILSRGLDGAELVEAATQLSLTVHHENVRGGDYYDRKETDPS
ncbi:MAG TPA: IS21 family transposase [Gaiellaceae bacterium]|nr:IS21 family transposase [Gaiellaceae bacterium]